MISFLVSWKFGLYQIPPTSPTQVPWDFAIKSVAKENLTAHFFSFNKINVLLLTCSGKPHMILLKKYDKRNRNFNIRDLQSQSQIQPVIRLNLKSCKISGKTGSKKIILLLPYKTLLLTVMFLSQPALCYRLILFNWSLSKGQTQGVLRLTMQQNIHT